VWFRSRNRRSSVLDYFLFAEQSGNYRVVARIEMPKYSPFYVLRVNQPVGSDLAGTCSCGQFVVSMEGEAYYVRTGGPNRKFWLDLADDTGFAR
jgi:hypothetical protein